MRNILGLDLGTNSIGWALIDDDSKKIVNAGSRIIPMDAATIGDYEKGNLKSPASYRTDFRSTRRLLERAKLRRERLLRVLNVMGFLPSEFKSGIDFENRFGKFKEIKPEDSEKRKEPLIAYHTDSQGKRVFSFRSSFEEMIEDFRENHPDMLADGKKIPYDWTIYYLREKALTKAVTKEELAWIILNFNAKRGYYQLRGENEETQENKREEYKILQVEKVENIGENKKKSGYKWYEVTYTGGYSQKITAISEPKKIGDEVELIVTTELDKDGNIKKDKEGDDKIKVRTPKEEDWTLVKKRTETNIRDSGKTVGSYIYHNILSNPSVKVRGKLVHTIERKFYRDELELILNKQKEFIPELKDKELYMQCVKELYRSNDAHVESMKNRDLAKLFVEDIIFYQRPLKTKKGSVAECQYEKYYYKDKETGEIKKVSLKCTPKSNPLYQELRLWQFINNLRIYERRKEVDGKVRTDVDVTSEFITSEDDYVNLFEWLKNKKKIKQEQLLGYKPFGISKKNIGEYRWNYVEDKEYPCCETLYDINTRLAKADYKGKLSTDDIQHLWHILYSVNDIVEIEKALAKFAEKHTINEIIFVEKFSKYALENKDYGAYSEKAIKRLLPLMRMGSLWKYDDIDEKTKKRIENIINGVADDTIDKEVREKLADKTSPEDFKGLPLWLACYVVYNRHSEAEDLTRWTSPDDIDDYLKNHFKQHSMRNPIVEGVVGETLRVVKDIWEKYGDISEIHVELGRELKQNAEKRKQATIKILENEKTNTRIKAMLREFVNPDFGIEDVRPNSPSQQEILKIYEESALKENMSDLGDDLKKIIENLGNSKESSKVSHSDVLKYKMWLEQKYKSPYTGYPIPLSKLFTPAYEIEHIIPQSRYFDDSFGNKVICESEVNKEKGNLLGYEFILKKGGSIVKGAFGKDIKLFDKKQYEDFVKEHYANNRHKMKNLMLEDIPESFTNRQLNGSRYISKKIIEILSHIVREENDKGYNSKNIISTNGSITDKLKEDWGIKDKWNDLIAPRFKRMNEKTNSNSYGCEAEKNGKRYFKIDVPPEISAGFSKKRIDHRHHAMDAIVIACTTRSHVNYLNNVYGASDKNESRKDLRDKLCTKVKTDDKGNYVWRFNKPWETFTYDTQKQLENIIVSFKKNIRVINKTTNYYQHYVDGKKVVEKQKKGDGWAIRKSLHKDTVSGKIKMKAYKTVKLADALKDIDAIKDKEIRSEIKKVIEMYSNYDDKTIIKYFKDRDYKVNGKDFRKIEISYNDYFAASRVAIDDSFDDKKIDDITDSGIREIMRRHLKGYGKNDPKIAFSPEGIEEMNKNIKELNNGKDHKPIKKVRKKEILGMKFAVGQNGNKTEKFVEADKGTNLFFAIYANEEGKRSFESIPLNVAIERQKANLNVAEDYDEKGNKLLFVISPNDLVYVPDDEDQPIGNITGNKNIYKMVSCTGTECYFVPETYAKVIADKKELGSMNKVESYDGINIKNKCFKIEVDRLGCVTKIYK